MQREAFAGGMACMSCFVLAIRHWKAGERLAATFFLVAGGVFVWGWLR